MVFNLVVYIKVVNNFISIKMYMEFSETYYVLLSSY